MWKATVKEMHALMCLNSFNEFHKQRRAALLHANYFKINLTLNLFPKTLLSAVFLL